MNVAALLMVAGLALLLGGAEALVRGAARLASALGVSPLLVGLTIVAWGTSAPELVVSTMAAWSGRVDIAVGNVVGSNVFNVLFILGAAAAVAPLAVSRQLVRIEVPLLVLTSLLVWWFATNGHIGRSKGFLLLLLGVAYTALAVRMGATADQSEPVVVRTQPSRAYNVALIVAGVGLLVVGARWFVHGAAEVARWLGVSELVIGLTIVAGGTSAPEFATSVVAAFKKERDLSVGNVIGSNLFNLFFVLGAAASIAPQGVPVAPAALHFDFPVMVAVAVACLPVFFTGQTIARWEGWLFLGHGAAYWAYLLFASAEHDALPMFSNVMLVFVIPLTLVTLLVSVARQLRRARRPQPSL
ncbi:MAG: calcium/sodium antiporter [Candidatus Binatia bacterium]|nr:calcium/sodium antiporter [Candidatus Binatia bacterium]